MLFKFVSDWKQKITCIVLYIKEAQLTFFPHNAQRMSSTATKD